MNSKGQFMIISAIIASLIMITLSASVSNIQSQTYETDQLSYETNQIQTEIKKITDGGISSKEKRNFRKMLGYYENYQTTANFDDSEPCVQVTLESTDKRVEMPCIN